MSKGFLVFGFALLAMVGSSARGEDCALCKKTIPTGKGVSATIGTAKVRYRCIHCALTGIQHQKAPVKISAKTPLDGRTISLKRQSGTWSQSPSTTVFLILPERANECLDLHQPFASKSEFARYLQLHPEIAKQKPQAFTIAQYEKMLTAGRPASRS